MFIIEHYGVAQSYFCLEHLGSKQAIPKYYKHKQPYIDNEAKQTDQEYEEEHEHIDKKRVNNQNTKICL